MENKKKLINVFAESLNLNQDLIVDSLGYNTIPEWDSTAHMILVAELENQFDIMLDTDDIIDMSSVAKAQEILAKYDISFDA